MFKFLHFGCMKVLVWHDCGFDLMTFQSCGGHSTTRPQSWWLLVERPFKLWFLALGWAQRATVLFRGENFIFWREPQPSPFPKEAFVYCTEAERTATHSKAQKLASYWVAGGCGTRSLQGWSLSKKQDSPDSWYGSWQLSLWWDTLRIWKSVILMSDIWMSVQSDSPRWKPLSLMV